MTALKPQESWNVVPVGHDEERKLLRRLALNPTCAHPDCDLPTTCHHAWPQGFINSSSYFVRIPGQDKPVFHAVGLCGDGTTGHHGDAEEHRGWIKYEDGVWNWYDRDKPHLEDGPTEPVWKLVGPLSPQPGEVAPARKKRKATTSTDRRKSKFVRFRVPDDAENGAGVISDLVQVGREQWASELGWGDDVPDYFVICAAFARAFQGG